MRRAYWHWPLHSGFRLPPWQDVDSAL